MKKFNSLLGHVVVVVITFTVNSKPFALSLQPLTAFAELRYGRRDFAKIEGRKTEKGKVGHVSEGEVGG